MGGPTYELIVSQFDQCRKYADNVFKQLTDINGYLWKLANAASGEMQELDMSWIEYDWPEPDIGWIPFHLRPTPPDDDNLTIRDIAVPELPSLREIELPAFPELPVPDIPDWRFHEEMYTSEVLDRLKARLLELSKSGSLGIPAEAADAIFSQARRRNEIGDAKLYEEAMNFWAARGFTLPPMMLAARLEDARIEIERRNSDINEKIMIQQAQMEVEGWKNILAHMISLEGAMLGHSDAVNGRALEEAKAVVQTALDAYKTKVEGYAAAMEGIKAQADVQIAVNKQSLDIYLAQIEKYKADLQLAVSRVEVIVKAYAARVEGYGADIKAGSAQLEAEVKAFQARVDQAKNQTELMLESSRAVLQAFISNRNLTIEAAKDGASICAQLVASALSAIHASASGGYSTSESYDQTKSDPTYHYEKRWNYGE
ncbi:MAG TPA: hypothetical protein PK250_12725 [Syntrophobacter fumaroxidans]|nr:hypothetical protein [Syntrophobacter fumaroxidans]